MFDSLEVSWCSIAAACVLTIAGVGCIEDGDVETGADGGDTADRGESDTREHHTGGCGEGTGGSVPRSSAGSLVATRSASGAVAVDGRFRERDASGFEFADPTGTSDNRVVMQGRWTPSFLYLGVKVNDAEVESEASTGPWLDDGVEVAFDTQADGGSELQGDDRKWLVTAEGRTSVRRGDGGNWVRWEESTAEMAADRTGDGYVVEMRIPWSEIGGLSSAKRTGGPGLVVVINDRDGGGVDRFTWTGPIDQLQSPSEWGTVRVAEASCGGETGPASDTSDGGSTMGDTADTGDGDGGTRRTSRLGPPRYVHESDFQFNRTLHAVNDLGMDPTGQQPIDAILDRNHKPNTLIVFPPGKYRIEAGPDRNATHNWTGEVDHFGIKGLGEKPKDVQFVLEKQSANYGGRWLVDHGGEGLMLKNFAIQMHRDRYTSADMWIQKTDLLLIERVEWAGLVPTDDHGNVGLLTAEITTQSGVGELNRVYIREGSYMPGYPDGTAGVRLSLGHHGTMYLTDLWIENLSSSAMRFSKAPGRVGVEGGFFKNNANTNLRGGAGSHPDGSSYFRGSTVVIDTSDYNDYQPEDQPLTSAEGIRVDSTGQGYSGLIVEDVDFHFLNVPGQAEVISRPGFGEHGAATFRNVRIRNETSAPVAGIDDVSKPSRERIRFENLQVTGSGAGELRAGSGTSAEIVDSCVESNFAIQNIATTNVDRSGCKGPTSSTTDPHAH